MFDCDGGDCFGDRGACVLSCGGFGGGGGGFGRGVLLRQGGGLVAVQDLPGDVSAQAGVPGLGELVAEGVDLH